MNYIAIYPKTIITTAVDVQSMSIEVHSIQLNSNITFKITLYKTEDLNLYPETITQYVKIEGEEYAQWGNDDAYVIQKICEKLGVTLTT
jgi:predicted nucleotidyltransferase